jgi:hypothetical protein
VPVRHQRVHPVPPVWAARPEKQPAPPSAERRGAASWARLASDGYQIAGRWGLGSAPGVIGRERNGWPALDGCGRTRSAVRGTSAATASAR